MTGKAIIPIVRHDSFWQTCFLDTNYIIHDQTELAQLEALIANRGYYPVIVTPAEFYDLSHNSVKQDQLFRELMIQRLELWIEEADKRLAGTGIRCFVCPGNDDLFEVDEVIQRSRIVQLADGRVVEFDGYQMVSTSWSNITPWHTVREEPEEALYSRIKSMLQHVTAPPHRVIFNLHCPPYASGLDEAPEVTSDLRTKYAGRATRPAGSKAVRQLIEQFQPLVSLHGHIHEGRGAVRIRRTLCVNPGSAYEQGQLFGVLLDLNGDETLRRYLLTVG